MSRHPRQPGATDKEERFLTRWSRRKQQSNKEETVEPENEAAADAEDQAATAPVKRDEDMPAIESIDENSDVSDFFSPGVSEALRKVALRKFFHSPAFNVVDGLDDYDDDFKTFQALGDIVTADMRHQQELEQQRKEERENELADSGRENAEMEDPAALDPEGEQGQAAASVEQEESDEVDTVEDPEGDSRENEDDQNRTA